MYKYSGLSPQRAWLNSPRVMRTQRMDDAGYAEWVEGEDWQRRVRHGLTQKAGSCGLSWGMQEKQWMRRNRSCGERPWGEMGVASKIRMDMLDMLKPAQELTKIWRICSEWLEVEIFKKLCCLNYKWMTGTIKNAPGCVRLYLGTTLSSCTKH